MFGRLFLLFTVMTLTEIFLLIEIGGFLGAGTTVGLVLLTAFVGAWMARREGVRVLTGIQRDLERGVMPADGAVDAVCVLIAAVMLITPGVVTDGLGFLLLVPITRAAVKTFLVNRLRSAAQQGAVHVVRMDMGGGPAAPPPFDDGDVIDVTPTSGRLDDAP